MLTIAEPTTDTVAGHRASTPAIEVIGVTQRTQDRTTLHDVSFSVTPGEVVALVGGSGAGKTTLLETMLGIRPPAGPDRPARGARRSGSAAGARTPGSGARPASPTGGWRRPTTRIRRGSPMR